MAATESWPPNLDRATRLLGPRGVVVVADPDEPPLPFADAAFDLVLSRHPATVWWDEIARVLQSLAAMQTATASGRNPVAAENDQTRARVDSVKRLSANEAEARAGLQRCRRMTPHLG